MEIKSRMWDTLKKEMRCEPFLKTGDGKGDWIVFLNDQSKEEKYRGRLVFDSPHPREKFIETEYAKIKDKNGKEVYGGDIMRIELSQIYSMSSGHILESKTVIGDVKIRPASGVGIIVRKVEGNNDGIEVGKFLKLKKGRDEIIGNVFENIEIIREVK